MRRFDDKFFGLKTDIIHIMHQRFHRQDYQFISEVLENYHHYGGLKHRFQHYKLFELIKLLLKYRPCSILELGSGSSTAVFTKYISQFTNKGIFYTIDESEEWLCVSKKVSNVKNEKNIKFICARRIYNLDTNPVEAKYDLNLNFPFDMVFIDGPSLTIGGVKYKGGINTNIFDICADYLPMTIIVDIRKPTVNEIINRLGDFYKFKISDVFERNIRLNYNYFSIFIRK